MQDAGCILQWLDTGLPIAWDGTGDAGQHVASGVYFYRLVAPGFTRTRKMVLLK